MTRRFLVLSMLLLPLLGCGAEESYTIGLVAPLSGEFAIYGEPVRKGVVLAHEEIQQNPDMPPIALEVVDTESEVEVARRELERLYQQGAIGAIGGVMSSVALELVKVADRFDRVLLSPSASSPELTGISKNFYRVFPSDFLEGTKLANFVVQELGVEDVLILAKTEPYAKGVQQVFEAEFQRGGGNVVEILEYPPTLTDLSDIIAHALDTEADGIFLAAFALDVAKMLKGLREGGYEGRIFTTSAFATPEGLAKAGEAADGAYLTQTVFDVSSEEPHVKSFVEAFREKYGSDPDLYAAHGYDAMKIMARGLVEQEIRTPSDYWRSLRSIREHPGVTGAIQFDERGDVQKFPRVYVIKEGVLFDYESDVAERRQELLEQLRKLKEKRLRALSEGG